MKTLAALGIALGLVATNVGAKGIVCHIDYGGERLQLAVQAAADPFAVQPVAVGSYLLFRAVVSPPDAQAASVRIFVYADRDEGPVPIHVAEYPHPLGARQSKPGFTGWQSVYEPVRDGELQYWCARSS